MPRLLVFIHTKTLLSAHSSLVLTQDLPLVVGFEIDVINERDLLCDPRSESEAKIWRDDSARMSVEMT